MMGLEAMDENNCLLASSEETVHKRKTGTLHVLTIMPGLPMVHGTWKMLANSLL